MNNGGDAAEQIVRLSLEGFEVAVRLTGSAAKNIAILLASVLKQGNRQIILRSDIKLLQPFASWSNSL